MAVLKKKKTVKKGMAKLCKTAVAKFFTEEKFNLQEVKVF